MSSDNQSLLAPGDSQQPRLLPDVPDDCFFEKLEAKGEFTGERLYQQRPDAYRACVVLLGQKLGVIRIGKLLGLSPNSVMGVRDREGATIDIVKGHLARIAHAGATLASEAITEALNAQLQRPDLLEIKDLKDLAVVYGILVQNGQLLAGQPTARLETTEGPSNEQADWNAYVTSLKPAKTHEAGEKSAAKEEARRAVIDLAPVAPATAAGDQAPGKTDSYSEGKAHEC